MKKLSQGEIAASAMLAFATVCVLLSYVAPAVLEMIDQWVTPWR
jgi:hypothetical protein